MTAVVGTQALFETTDPDWAIRNGSYVTILNRFELNEEMVYVVRFSDGQTTDAFAEELEFQS